MWLATQTLFGHSYMSFPIWDTVFADHRSSTDIILCRSRSPCTMYIVRLLSICLLYTSCIYYRPSTYRSWALAELLPCAADVIHQQVRENLKERCSCHEFDNCWGHLKYVMLRCKFLRYSLNNHELLFTVSDSTVSRKEDQPPGWRPGDHLRLIPPVPTDHIPMIFVMSSNVWSKIEKRNRFSRTTC